MENIGRFLHISSTFLEYSLVPSKPILQVFASWERLCDHADF